MNAQELAWKEYRVKTWLEESRIASESELAEVL